MAKYILSQIKKSIKDNLKRDYLKGLLTKNELIILLLVEEKKKYGFIKKEIYTHEEFMKDFSG